MRGSKNQFQMRRNLRIRYFGIQGTKVSNYLTKSVYTRARLPLCLCSCPWCFWHSPFALLIFHTSFHCFSSMKQFHSVYGTPTQMDVSDHMLKALRLIPGRPFFFFLSLVIAILSFCSFPLVLETWGLLYIFEGKVASWFLPTWALSILIDNVTKKNISG